MTFLKPHCLLFPWHREVREVTNPYTTYPQMMRSKKVSRSQKVNRVVAYIRTYCELFGGIGLAHGHVILQFNTTGFIFWKSWTADLKEKRAHTQAVWRDTEKGHFLQLCHGDLRFLRSWTMIITELTTDDWTDWTTDLSKLATEFWSFSTHFFSYGMASF
jgi:hypothetical protein